MSHKVIVTEHLGQVQLEWLASQVSLERCSHTDTIQLQHALREATGLVVRTYTKVDEALLDQAPKLQVVGRAGVGLDNIDLEACRRRKVRVVHTPDANTQAVVEYVWTLLFDALRPRHAFSTAITAEEFHHHRQTLHGRQLDTMTIGILGFGRIGRRIAQVADAFGLRVLYNDVLTPTQLQLPTDHPGLFVEKAQLWRESDILTIHTDGRKSNHQLLNASVLAQLRPSCIILNAARGMLVDNNALADWAQGVVDEGGRALLDVHAPEPPPKDYPLFGHPNVVLLPHLASRTTQALANMSWVVRDVLRVLRGEAPQWAAV